MKKIVFRPSTLLKAFRPPEFVRVPFLFSYIVMLTSYLLVLVFYFRLPPIVPIFYSLAQPSQHLAAKEWIFLFPVFLTLITVGHLSLIQTFSDYEKLLLQLFSWTSFVIITLVFASLVRILVIIS